MQKEVTWWKQAILRLLPLHHHLHVWAEANCLWIRSTHAIRISILSMGRIHTHTYIHTWWSMATGGANRASESRLPRVWVHICSRGWPRIVFVVQCAVAEFECCSTPDRAWLFLASCILFCLCPLSFTFSSFLIPFIYLFSVRSLPLSSLFILPFLLVVCL
jgi:hypothetical protein